MALMQAVEVAKTKNTILFRGMCYVEIKTGNLS